MDPVHQEVDRLYKEHFGKMVASLVYSSRDIDIETAEDLVHDSFSAALKDWNVNGIPLSTTGWLYKVCKNKALNKIRTDKLSERLSKNTTFESVEIKFAESVLEDHIIRAG